MPSEDTVVSELRAALLSSKTPLRIQDVNSDYKVLNGYSIPFKEFGHKSLEEFLTKLKDKGEITMKYEGGNLMVHAIPKGASAHVADLISKQKSSKKRGAPSFRGRGGSRFGGRGGRGGGYGSRSSYKPPSSFSSYKPVPAYSNSYKSSSMFSSAARPPAQAYYPEGYKPGPPAPKPYKPPASKPQPDFQASISGPKKPPEKSVNARLSKHSFVSSTLPPRLQKRLGPKVFGDDEFRQNNFSTSPEESERIVKVVDGEWEDRVVAFVSSPYSDRSGAKISPTVDHKDSNAQSNTLQSEAIAPRFQKRQEEKRNQDFMNEPNAYSNSTSHEIVPNASSQIDSMKNSSLEDTSPQNASSGMTRRPGDYLEKARASMQAKKVQQLAQEYLPSGGTGMSNSADPSLNPRDHSISNNQLPNNQLQNGHASLPRSVVRLSAPSAQQGFNINFNVPAILNPQSLVPLNIANSGLTALYPAQNRTLLPTPNIPPLFPVNPGQPSFIPLSRPSPNFIYPLSTSQPNSLVMNGVNPALGVPPNLPLSNGVNGVNSTLGNSVAQNGPDSEPPSNLSKPISGVSMRSATPAQDRLKRLHQPLNPDPKPPLPSSLSKIYESSISPPINSVQSLVNSVNTLHLNEMQISPNEKSLINSESDTDSSPVPFVEKLSRLVEKVNLSVPTYKTITRYCKTERKTLYASVVTLGPEKKYSTAPEEYSTEADAQEAAARAAFLDLTKKLRPPSQRLRWHTTASPYVIGSRIACLLEGRTNGIWSDEIPNMYVNQYKELLPDDFVQLISDFPELDVILVGGRAIISPKSPNKFPSPPPLEVPDTPTWDVFVSLPRSTVEVWIRLIGDNYSDKYSDLLDEMELSYQEVKPEDYVVSPEVGNYYAIKFNELWFRVQLIKMKDGACECRLIDNGDLDVFEPEQLFTLDPLFLKLPAQAVKCSLNGLESYADSPQSQTFLNVIQGGSFVAGVMSRKEPYSIELYDTRTDDNTHMNEELLQKLDAENSAPLLPSVGCIRRDVRINVSHVSESGEIFLQFHTNHFEIVKNLIDEITEEDEKTSRVTDLSDVNPHKLYLAKFSDGEWYRAGITNINADDDIEVFFIDYGNSHSVSLSELLSLDKLPNFLSLILPQAILVHLDSVPPSVFSEKLADKIRELVPEDEEVLVKKVTDEEIPKMEIFIRMSPQNMLASVNNTIIMDPKFAKLAEEKDQNLNVFGKDNSSVSDDTNTNSSKRSSENSTPEPLPNTNLKVDAKPFIPKTTLPDHYEGQIKLESVEGRQNSTVASIDIDGLKPADLQPFEVPKIDSGFLAVFVVNIANPYNFTIQTEDSKKTLEQLEKEMNNFYNKYNLSKKKDITVGETYAVKQSDGVWRRFTVTSLISEHCIGGFPDTGGFQMFLAQDIYPLMPTYKNKPVLAVRAKLAGIKPKCKDWDVADTLQFRSMVEDKKLKCRVALKTKDHIELDLFEFNAPNQNIAQQLINNNCAVRSI